MSRRSVKERNKAIRLAWEREQKLVADGKGTRDWSPEQQKDILDPDKGKAYDENGRAYEGQHMKSAVEYPEFQGNPDNIQFLTREEHLEAHKGSWQNPTNWYYNPKTKEFVDFGENKPIPCKAINLSEPVRSPVIDKQNKNDELKEPSKVDAASSKNVKPSRRKDAEHHSERSGQSKTKVVSPEVSKNLVDKVHHAFNNIKEFCKRNPELVDQLKGVAVSAFIFGAKEIVNRCYGSGSGSRSFSSDNYSSHSSDDTYADSLGSDNYNISSFNRDYPDKRSSPEVHTVSAHGQHYHTNDGVVWKEKKPYQRGGKHDD